MIVKVIREAQFRGSFFKLFSLRYICFFFLIAKSFVSHGQNIALHGELKSSKNNTPIPYAYLILNGKNGTITNQQGQFKMRVSETDLKDTLLISSIGYKSKEFQINELVNCNNFNCEIYLEPLSIRLKEVEIKPRKSISNRIGPSYNKDECQITQLISLHRLPEQIAIFLQPKKEAVIKDVGFFIAKEGKPKTAFRIQVYDRHPKSGLPNKRLLNTNVYATPKRGNRWVKVGLEEHNIQVPKDGFFIAMEILNIGKSGIKIRKFKQYDEEKSTLITKLDTTYGAHVNFCRASENNDYKQFYFSKQTKWGWLKSSHTYPLIYATVVYE